MSEKARTSHIEYRIYPCKYYMCMNFATKGANRCVIISISPNGVSEGKHNLSIVSQGRREAVGPLDNSWGGVWGVTCAFTFQRNYCCLHFEGVGDAGGEQYLFPFFMLTEVKGKKITGKIDFIAS